MDEADRLCDRIAIVDHGKLVALDTPPALKASVPGSNVIEAQFDTSSRRLGEELHALSGVTSVQHEGAGMYRVLTGDGSRTTTELVEMAVQAGVRSEIALGAEHHPGRCIRPLHGTAAAR